MLIPISAALTWRTPETQVKILPLPFGSFACMLINFMRHGMTPAGVPAYTKRRMYLAGKGYVHFSPKKLQI